MKKLVTILSIALIAGLLYAGDDKQVAQKPTLDTLKVLVGDWKAKTKEGEQTVSYQLVSGGFVLMETMNASQHDKDTNMVTLYHMDGDTLMLTHYCAIGNQPRMKADPTSDNKVIKFKFVDVTNLKSPADGHMHDLAVTLVDADHFKQEWTFYENGKPSPTEVFEFTRVKK